MITNKQQNTHDKHKQQEHEQQPKASPKNKGTEHTRPKDQVQNTINEQDHEHRNQNKVKKHNQRTQNTHNNKEHNQQPKNTSRTKNK